MRATWFHALSLGFCLPLLSGCGPAIPEQDLGEVVYTVPEIPDAKPFVLPESNAKPPADHEPPH